MSQCLREIGRYMRWRRKRCLRQLVLEISSWDEIRLATGKGNSSLASRMDIRMIGHVPVIFLRVSVSTDQQTAPLAQDREVARLSINGTWEFLFTAKRSDEDVPIGVG